MCVNKVTGQHPGSALLCWPKAGATFFRELFWLKCLLRGLPLTQQTVCLKLLAGGWKKEVCKRLCPLNWLSSWRGKWSLLFYFSVCAQMDLPHQQQSAVHSTLCQGLSFYALRMLNTCLITSKVLLYWSVIITVNGEGTWCSLPQPFVWPGSLNQPSLMNGEWHLMGKNILGWIIQFDQRCIVVCLAICGLFSLPLDE